MSISNNIPSAENSSGNINQILRQLGFDFYIDQNGTPQSKRSRILDPEKLLTDPVLLSRLKGGWFISDPTRTQWIYISIRNGRIAEFIPVASLFILGLLVINYHEGKFDLIYIRYSTNTSHTDPQSAVIHYSNYTPSRITIDIKGLAYLSKEGEALKGALAYYLVSQSLLNVAPQNKFDIGPKQGWWITPQKQYRFAPERNYIPEIKAELAMPLQYRESSKQNKERYSGNLQFQLFEFDNKKLLMLLLFNLASLLLTFFVMNGVFPNNILVLKPTENIDSALLMAILNNVNYSTFNRVPPVGPQIKELKNALSWVNDGIIVVLDIFSADQYKKAEPGYDLILNNVEGASQGGNNVIHIIALISGYADLHLPQEKCCVIEFGDSKTKSIPIQYSDICRKVDDALINKIESDYKSFITIFKKHFEDVSKNIPDLIPKSKVNTFIILITTLRFFNDMFTPFFSADFENEIISWLSSQDHDQQSVDDVICSDYMSKLNKRMDNNYYNYTSRVRHGATPFDKGLHTIIVDMEERLFFIEPEENFIIVKEDMPSINDTDRLTTALYNEKYQRVNEHNSKCFRIRTSDSNGVSHTTRMHAISFDIVSPENQKRFALIGKDEYLFRHDELPTDNFLPLIKTADGRYAGKMLRYTDEESNNYFGTGRTGSGKSWAIAQIIVMLFMLGNLVVVFDVSGSYTKEKLLKMLPDEVVEKLFKFINVGVGNDPIPIDLGSLRGCETLPDRKRTIYSVLRAATGAIDKSVSIKFKGFLSDYLKDKEYSVNLNNLVSELEETGVFGAEIVDRIKSVLDDIREVGYDEQTWNDLFKKDKKIIIINLGNEVGDSNHQLLDMLVGNLFKWQMSHDNEFLSIAIDELIDQDFSIGSPLQTIVKQGRKFHTALIGATQDYFNQGSSNLDVMKQANIKSFSRPGKSEDRVAQKLGYSNAAAAGFNNFKAGDVIIDADFYNRELDMNVPTVIKGSVVNFVDTPLYDLFKEKYLEPPKNYYDNTR